MSGRNMRWKGQTVTVYEHLITKGYWEFYLIDSNYNEDRRLAIVMGHECEMGDVSMSEIKPLLVSRTMVNDEIELAPAQDGEWIETKRGDK